MPRPKNQDTISPMIPKCQDSWPQADLQWKCRKGKSIAIKIHLALKSLILQNLVLWLLEILAQVWLHPYWLVLWLKNIWPELFIASTFIYLWTKLATRPFVNNTSSTEMLEQMRNKIAASLLWHAVYQSFDQAHLCYRYKIKLARLKIFSSKQSQITRFHKQHTSTA